MNSPAAAEPSGNIEANRFRVRFKEVSRSFADGTRSRTVLSGVTLNVAPGEMVAIMGPSGSGKSTLLRMAGGLDRPDSGEIFVDGSYLSSLDAKGLAALRRTTVGFVEQNLNLLGALSAAENVALPLELDGVSANDAKRQAYEALERVDLLEVARQRPEDLSGGEQQRVAIARALIGERCVIIADEPSASLDSLTGESIMRLLRSRCDTDGATLLLSTHNAAHAAFADRIVYLRDGILTDPGRLDDVATNELDGFLISETDDSEVAR